MAVDLSALTASIPGPETVLQALTLFVVAAIVGNLVARGVERLVRRGGNLAFASMSRRAVAWAGAALGAAAGLETLGFDLSVLLGAAGVLTVAVGFASQTSASNIISGLFLVMEGSVDKGDVVQIGGTTGEVLHVGLLSIRLRTFDNRLVRIPNETLMKAEILNFARLPIRRITVELTLAPEVELDPVLDLLKQAAEDEPLVLQEPAPRAHVNAITDLGPRVTLWGWTTTGGFVDVQTALLKRVHARLRAAGVPMATARRQVIEG
jgi:small-conductance mechanosensitive channel